ncbi:MAG: amidohydrolase family protein, partial [Planctomycetes bacterium]|nr:amidohydrolase family protein [Planctomycetota bacterium]
MATTLFTNGEFVTLDSRRPRAEALAVRDGRIVAIGSQAEVRAAAGEVGEVVDLGGRTVLPGFIDAHVHMVWTGMAMQGVDLVDAP